MSRSLQKTDAQNRRRLFWREVASPNGSAVIHELHPSTDLLVALNIADSTWCLLEKIVQVPAETMSKHLNESEMKELRLLLNNRGLYLGMSEEDFQEAFTQS